jgi:ABC-2 type transport system permease protein
MSLASRRILALVRARNREFYRDKAGLGWNIFMPMMMIFGFAFLFSGGSDDRFTVGIIGKPLAPAETLVFLDIRHIRFIDIETLDSGVDKIRHHRLDMLLDLHGNGRYWINEQSTNGYFLEKLLLAADGGATSRLQRQTVNGRQIRYVDWAMPGILALNMMFSSLWGVGWVIVRYRKNGVLRRLCATPLSALEFLTAQVLSRLLVVASATLLVFFCTHWLLDFPMRGSYVGLLLLFAAGALCMISLGLLVAARIRSEELADGLLNLISWPMMIGSGIWFSMEGTHPLAQLASQFSPLTHLVNGARAIMLDGAALAEVMPQLLLLLALGSAFLLLAARSFRWQ